MKRSIKKNRTRAQRQHSVRSHMNTLAGKPRFSVHRSNTNLYVQVIDDVAGKTVASGSMKEVKGGKKAEVGARIEKARELGKLVAQKAIKAGVSAVMFDRGRYAYHGRVKALAEGAREGGLKF